ncbi:hypothetical protein SLS64_000846 [Diaporthe eres]|uniref:2EXR domain-containing protein n=1 Tax=Diaporthe eres TaxID=83184 RepID=A0ABR1P4C7_DIAER
MAFLSFLGSLLPKRLFADNTYTNQTEESDEDIAIMEQSETFHLFFRLPAELRHMIIREVLHEHEEATHRVVLFDPLTYRISPTKELASMASPLLFVNSEFRDIALKVYTKVDVFDLGAPTEDQYGHESAWYMVPMNRDYLLYFHPVCDQMEEELKDQSVQKGCLYINPKKDTFITGIVPRQVALTTTFLSQPGDPDQPWKIPRDFVTEQLEDDTCAKITSMRELEWDLDDRCLGCGTCLLCGRIGRPCCTEDFFDGRGAEWRPLYNQGVFTGVESFGFYLLTAGDDMQQFLHNLTVMGGKDCLEEEWDEKYLEFDLERLQV